MKDITDLRSKNLLIVFIIFDIIIIAFGQGVPIWPIVLGFLFGYFIAKKVLTQRKPLIDSLSLSLRYASILALVTLAIMIVVWAPKISLFFDPDTDFSAQSNPLVLYEAETSFAVWLIIMILVSPLFQLLTTIFGSYYTFLKKFRK